VHDAAFVRHRERDEGLEHELDRALDPEALFVLEQTTEIAPHQMFHHHVRRSVVELPQIEHLHHVLVPDFRQDPRFAPQAGERLRMLGELAQQDLDRDLFIQLQVPRRENQAHPTSADETLDSIFSEQDLSWQNRGFNTQSLTSVGSLRLSGSESRRRFTFFS
jgi:hypothetical protein